MSEQVLTDFEIVQILNTDRPKAGWSYGLCREIEAKVVSRCRAQGGNTNDNITQAAANKAEVEPVAFVTDKYSLEGYNDEISALLPVGTKLYATPPSTTGASTVLTDERGAFDKWFADNKFGGMKDSMWAAWEARSEVAAQAGQVAATELQVRRATDELSLPELAEQFAAVEALGCDYTLSAKVCGKLFRAMTTPPDDPAGQVAVPEDVARDAARYRWLRGPATDIANVIDKEFAPGMWEYKAGEELDVAIDEAMQSPSPAKESK